VKTAELLAICEAATKGRRVVYATADGFEAGLTRGNSADLHAAFDAQRCAALVKALEALAAQNNCMRAQCLRQKDRLLCDRCEALRACAAAGIEVGP